MAHKESMLASAWQSLISAAQKHFLIRVKTQPVAAVVPGASQHHPAVHGPETEAGHRVQTLVRMSTLIVVVCLYLTAFVTLFVTRCHPREGREKAYVTIGEDHHPPDAPDTDDEGTGVTSTPQSKEAAELVRPVTHVQKRPELVRHVTQYLDSGHVTVDSNELVDNIGISAMCVFDPDSKSGISKIPNKVAVPLLALQSWCLQIGLLYFLTTQILPQASAQHRELPIFMIFIAVYLHFLNCIQEFPYSWQLFRHLPDFHQNVPHLILMGGVLISDAFVVPLLSFVLGGLYLCTSRTIGDAILNAVAVAFIREIDNWIVGLSSHFDLLSGKIKAKTVHLPINREVMKRIAWTITFVPFVPVVATFAICWMGLQVLKL